MTSLPRITIPNWFCSWDIWYSATVICCTYVVANNQSLGDSSPHIKSLRGSLWVSKLASPDTTTPTTSKVHGSTTTEFRRSESNSGYSRDPGEFLGRVGIPEIQEDFMVGWRGCQPSLLKKWLLVGLGSAKTRLLQPHFVFFPSETMSLANRHQYPAHKSP